MEYPGSTLTKRRRHYILAFFIIIFCITTPLLLLYTIGYRYDFQNGILKEIGAISVDVQPPDAQVFLNDQAVNEKIPVRLKNVTPGFYHLKISKEGYYDWKKDITVKSKQTIYIKDVTLIKKDTATLVTANADILVSGSTDGKYLIYSKKDSKTLVVRNSLTNTETDLPGVTYTSSTKITWSKTGSFFTLENSPAPRTSLLIFKTSNPAKKWDLAKQEGGAIQKYLWDNSNDRTIYYSTDKAIRTADAETKELATLTANTFLDWYFNGGQLWTMQFTTSTGELSIDRDTLGFISRFNTVNPGEINLSDTLNFRIQTIENNTALLTNTLHSTSILLNSHHTFSLATDRFATSPTGWWLLWSPWELWSSLGGSEPYLLNRSGIALRDTHFIDEYNTVALRSDQSISVLFPYYLVSQEIVSADMLSGLSTDPRTRSLYFSGTIKGESGLWHLNY